ncbi:MAG: recombinase family protein, partial [Streptosporangiales bacterium]
MTAITARLNADPEQYPPPKGGLWTEISVYEMLANPKYTGHMVWNRKKNLRQQGHRTQRHNPPEQWIWTPGPVHPAIITRELYDTAQQVTRARTAATGEPGEPAHPLARRTYEFRSLVRHRACKRRMCGTTRPAGIYYLCPHDT